MKRLMSHIEKETSITNMEMLVFRPVNHRHCTATLSCMLNSSLEWALKMNEYLDIQDAVEEHHRKEQENMQRT